MNEIIITCNAGSSNIKLAIYEAHNLQCRQIALKHNTEEVLDFIAKYSTDKVLGIGHRIVHGGREYKSPVHITPTVLAHLEKLSPLAPLHQPKALNLIWQITKLYPEAIQVGCFDTAFHRTTNQIDKLIALPSKFYEQGIERYGFHGVSYEYVASQLEEVMGKKSHGKVIVAHLGGGSSLCAMHKLESIATSMGFSTLDGLMMNTRSGSIDPGIILYMLQEMKMKPDDITNLLYNESGLKGVSGLTPDMHNLIESETEDSKKAIDLYCYMAAKHLGGLITILGGLNILVFTGGIGENSPLIRRHITRYLEWMGVKVDERKNHENSQIISTKDSSADVLVIPTNEENIIAEATKNVAIQ